MSTENNKSMPPETDVGTLNLACFDLMLIELVPLAERIADQAYRKSFSASLSNVSTPESTTVTASPGETGPDDPAIPPADEEEMREAVHYRLESLGYRVGLGVVESLSAQAPLPSSTAALDTIKFLCKDFWFAVFRKQIDNLKTNHRGVFVLTDNSFAPLRRCSLPPGMAEETRRRSVPFLQFPAGLIRGALSGLGMEAGVAVEVSGGGVPGVSVTIKT